MFGILGHSGYVGQFIIKSLDKRKLYYIKLNRDWENVLNKNKIDFLINAAGFTGKPNVDACETQKLKCIEGNVILPGKLHEYCISNNIKLGHVSSGCIYQGIKNSGFIEKDEPNFSFRSKDCSFYSGSKALGEEILEGINGYIWRLRIPFNEENSERNYLYKLIKYDKLLDAENSITNINEFGDACVDSFLLNIPNGTYNITNPGSVTTKYITDLMINMGIKKEFDFFSSESEFLSHVIAKRSNCVLDSSKALSVGLKLSPVKKSLKYCLRKFKNN